MNNHESDKVNREWEYDRERERKGEVKMLKVWYLIGWKTSDGSINSLLQRTAIGVVHVLPVI
jgi:hypothetical protein